MTRNSKQVLLDSVVVIDAHENQYWDALCNGYQIALPATVIEEEVFYFESSKGKKGLTPSIWIQKGLVTRIDAALTDYALLSEKLSNDFMNAIDPGEKEALAILLSAKHKQYSFVTADRAAIKALGILGLGYRGLSVEERLNQIGYPTARARLQKHFTKTWFKKYLTEGFSEQVLWLKKDCS